MSDKRINDHKKKASGILPISLKTKKICLAWRSSKVDQGQVWGIIGGMVKNGLTTVEGALLEMKEEVGYQGPIKLHKAFLYEADNGFTYQNYVGMIPQEFKFNPEPEYAYETEFISWMTYKTITELIESDPKTFHFGVISLFKESKDLIQSL